MSNTFHNTTAHYNAYFYANERIKEIEQAIEDGHEWNYNKILPIFPQFDSTLATSMASQIDDCVKKASIAIQRHPESNWEDNSYVLVGLARYYSMDFGNAIETFKYVNTHSENDNTRHEALIDLINTYIKMEEMKNAGAVSDYLKKEKLNKKNLKDLYLSRADLFQRREDLNFMVQNLTQAEPLITDHHERARISFIIGQVYQQLGFDGEAYQYYKKSLASNPTYELSFYTKLNMAQVTELTKNNDIKKVRKYFKGLLSDAKNVEFRDKIYYEMARFEVKQGNLEQGIEYYNSSVQASTKNKRQKAYSYLSLGKIYYDSLANYKLAKLYYDSTISVLPQDELEYESILERQKILENFVNQLTIIHDNDSLIALSNLSTDSLNVFLDTYITQKEAEEKEKKEKAIAKIKKRNNVSLNNSFNDEFIPIGSTNFDESVWYFYNKSAVEKGRYEFESRWGNRNLEDNWRRSNKSLQTIQETTTANDNQAKIKASDDENTNDEEKPLIDKNELIATIPYKEEQKAKLLAEVEEAHYQLGNIYNFNLEEKNNAASTFEKMLVRFEATEYKLEVMYLLYLIYKDLSNITRSDYFKNTLINDYPNSVYAKIIINPNYREESEAASGKLKKIYAQAYQMYKSGNNKAALATVNNGLEMYPDNDFVDNMQLLKILLIGKMENFYTYQYELNNFIRTYSESELLPYADSLVKASENFQIELINSTRAKFITNLNKSHYFVYTYNKDTETYELLLEIFGKLIAQHELNLSVQSLILDGKNSMILIQEFKDKEAAMTFDQLVKKVNPEDQIKKSGIFHDFIITKDNFDILYNTKELDSYLTFYRKNY
ncbi:methyltransferase [Reichenbachiella sp. MALMAid0571]|uniref:type IX secretion system periplasmic lipoprotein PorW/SprE n=1 Tax=Reichenbachiella sp. MALMAid0571 TaxID=3143939 RepID=UPI0032DE2E51